MVWYRANAIVPINIFILALLGRERDFVTISFPANCERFTRFCVLFHQRTKLSSRLGYLDRLLTGFQAPTF